MIKRIGWILLYIIITIELLSAMSLFIRLKPPISVPLVPLRMMQQMTIRFQIPILSIIVIISIIINVTKAVHERSLRPSRSVWIFMIMTILICEIVHWVQISQAHSVKNNLDYETIAAGEGRGQYRLELLELSNPQLSETQQCQIYKDPASIYKGTCVVYLNYGGWSVQTENYGNQIKGFCQKEGYTFVRFAVERKSGENILALAKNINTSLQILFQDENYDNIILCGGSAGGHLALLCGGKETGDPAFNIPAIQVDGVIALYPCVKPGYAYDYYVNSASKMLSKQTKELDEEVFGIRGDGNSYYELTDIGNCMDQEIPILIVQGDKDSMMPVEGSRILYEELCEKNDSISYLELPGVEHVFDMVTSLAWKRCEKEMTGFVREIDSEQ